MLSKELFRTWQKVRKMCFPSSSNLFFLLNLNHLWKQKIRGVMCDFQPLSDSPAGYAEKFVVSFSSSRDWDWIGESEWGNFEHFFEIFYHQYGRWSVPKRDPPTPHTYPDFQHQKITAKLCASLFIYDVILHWQFLRHLDCLLDIALLPQITHYSDSSINKFNNWFLDIG